MKYTALLAVTALGLASTAQAQFRDVALEHPHHAAIVAVQAAGIVGGYPDGSFQPDRTINRAEFVKILLGAQTDLYPECRMAFSLTDVDFAAWYGPFLQRALCGDIVAGYDDGTFRPSAMINYAEAAKVVAKTFALEIPTPAPNERWAWYTGFVRAVESAAGAPREGIEPNAELTRGEMAHLVAGLMSDTVPAANTGNAMANDVVDQINAMRGAADGLPGLTADPQLMAEAQRFSDRMVAGAYFTHSEPDGTETEDRFIASQFPFVYWGENLGRGQKTVEEAVRYWKESPAHYTNMMNPNFTHVGVGITKAKDTDQPYHNGYYWVLLFASK